MCCLIQNRCHSLLVMGPMLLGHYSLLAFHMVLVAIHPGKTAGHTTFFSGNILVSARTVELQGLKDGTQSWQACAGWQNEPAVQTTPFSCLSSCIYLEFCLIHCSQRFTMRNTGKYKQISMKHGLKNQNMKWIFLFLST